MAKKKVIKNKELEKVKETDEVVVWRMKRPLTRTQHGIISAILRDEEKASGKKIILAPSLVEVK